MAVEQWQSLPNKKISVWKRITSKRESTPTRAVSAPNPIITPSSPSPQKLRKRETQGYRNEFITEPSRKASTHLPLIGVEAPQTENDKPTKCENNPKEPMTIVNVQRIDVPAIRAKPRAVSLTRVASTDMPTNPFPTSPYVCTVGWKVFLTPEQLHNLVMGFSPVGVDDKWFIYSQGPDHGGKLKVHFHRSWTGTKIAELFIVVDLKGEGAGTIVGIKWNGTDQTNGMDEEEAKYMVSTTCSWVLDVTFEDALPAMKF